MALYVRTGNTGTDPDVDVLDLGITIATGASWVELTAGDDGDPDAGGGQFTARELRDSVDLHTAITGGSLEWSKNGSTVESAAAFIADVVLMGDFEDDTLDLGSGGLVLPFGTSVPGTGAEGQTFWKSDSDELYMYNGTSWEVIATASGVQNDHGSLDGLGDDDHSQYLLLSGDGTRNAVTGSIDMSGGDYFILPQAADVSSSFPAGTEGALAWDTDDDSLYAHDGTNWFAIAPASGIITDHGGLSGLDDDDHDQYGLLTGNATRNPVTGEYDFSSGDIILPSDGTFKGSPVAGNVEFKGGVLYAYDSTRTKWLSVDRVTYTAGRRQNRATNIYMRVSDGVPTSATGIRMLRDGTITGIFAQTRVAESWTFEVRRNGSVIASLVMTAVAGNQATTVNVDVSQGDEIQFYCNGTDISFPVGGIEVAWRESN